MPDPNAAAELHARLQTRALVDLTGELRAIRKASEDQTREIGLLRSENAAFRTELAAQTRAGFMAWADRNPWPAALLIIAVLLGLSGQLPLLSQLVPLGVTHASGS
jgi:hypothetical protein